MLIKYDKQLNFCLVDFGVLADNRMKIKESKILRPCSKTKKKYMNMRVMQIVGGALGTVTQSLGKKDWGIWK